MSDYVEKDYFNTKQITFLISLKVELNITSAFLRDNWICVIFILFVACWTDTSIQIIQSFII